MQDKHTNDMLCVQLLLVLIFVVTGGHAGATCTLYTCNGVVHQIYCANGCCEGYGAVYCCPDTTIAAVGGTVAGFLFFLLVVTGASCYLRHQRHKQYHSMSVQTQARTDLSEETIKPVIMNGPIKNGPVLKPTLPPPDIFGGN